MTAADTRQEPLVPSEVDLRDFAFMPLEVARLRRSKAWLIAKRKPEVGFYMMNLWCAAWHDVPAGSLEDDDDVLADLAMCSPARWAKVRDDALHGWVRCDDGRLYHPTVAEKALQSWEAKKAQRQRTEAARTAREQKKSQSLPGGDTRNVTKPATTPVTKSVTDNVTESKGEGEGEGEGQSSGSKEPSAGVRAPAERERIELRTAIAKEFQRAGTLPPETGRVAVWLAKGYRPDLILAVITEIISGGKTPKSLNYFDLPIEEAHAKPPSNGSRENGGPRLSGDRRGADRAAIRSTLDQIYANADEIDRQRGLAPETTP